jgi:IS4 transposase
MITKQNAIISQNNNGRLGIRFLMLLYKKKWNITLGTEERRVSMINENTNVSQLNNEEIMCDY